MEDTTARNSAQDAVLAQIKKKADALVFNKDGELIDDWKSKKPDIKRFFDAYPDLDDAYEEYIKNLESIEYTDEKFLADYNEAMQRLTTLSRQVREFSRNVQGKYKHNDFLYKFAKGALITTGILGLLAGKVGQLMCKLLPGGEVLGQLLRISGGKVKSGSDAARLGLEKAHAVKAVKPRQKRTGWLGAKE